VDDLKAYAELLEPGSITIFLLHGVIRQQSNGVRNYTRKHLPETRFDALCALLSQRGYPVDADEAVAMLEGKDDVPDRAFLLTFDDGFRNNLTVAAPLMERHGIPGVFYVTSGFVEHNWASWIDLVEDAVEKTRRRALRLPWSNEEWPLDTRAAQIALLDEVRRVGKTHADLDPYSIADQIRHDCGVGEFDPHPELDQKLSWAEVRSLARGAGFTVGGHSHSHPILTHLSPDELDWELDTSMNLLSQALGGPIRHYSYPEGLEHCYSDAVIMGLRDRGVVCAPTASPGPNRVGDDPFRLRRHLVV